MYFDVEPKSKREDFFNYSFEYGLFKKSLRDTEKIIAVVGVRRVGKTSLLNLIYNETDGAKLWLDGRIISDPRTEIFAAIHETVKSGRSKIFGKIESLNISAFGLGVGVKLGPESRTEMEKRIRGAGRVVVFIDEAQRMKGGALADVVSYFYDRLPQVTFALSGSEIGLVEEILGENDPKHPLYGREIVKVTMGRLSKSAAIQYLKEGFAQLGMSIAEAELSEAIEELDGLIGWLTLYGHERGVRKNTKAIARVTETAARIAASELENFLRTAKNRRLYLSILRNVNGTPWEELRGLASRDYGERLNHGLFAFALARLVKYTFVERRDERYHLSDPLLTKALYLV